MASLTDAQGQYVQYVLEGVPFLKFNYATGTFDVSDAMYDPTWEYIQLLYKAVQKLRFNPPPLPAFHTVRLDEIDTGYYDRCLEYYAYERLQLNKLHTETCWIRYAERTHCLGKIAPGAELDDEAKVRFFERLGRERKNDFIAMSIFRAYRKNPEIRHALKVDEEGWLMFFRGNLPIMPLSRTERTKIMAKDLVKKMIGYSSSDRILRLIESIENHGWDQDLARKPSGVLGFSRKTRRYLVFTGKHRIAALKYLYSQGRISGSTRIEYPVITYPWGAWRHGRPHPDSPVCEWC